VKLAITALVFVVGVYAASRLSWRQPVRLLASLLIFWAILWVVVSR
jgi:hypothetical protein